MSNSHADNDTTHLAEIEDFSRKLSASLPTHIQARALTLKSKLPFKALSIRELLIHRMESLTRAAVALLKQKQTIPAVILVRSIIEAVAVMYVFHERLDRFLKDPIKDIAALDSFLMSCLVGSGDNPDLPTPTNILTFVNRVEKNIPGFRNVYDGLCEYVHPNWAGTFGAFGQINEEKLELKLGPANKSSAYTVGLAALSGSLMIFELYYNESGDLVSKFNDYLEAGIA